MLFITVGEILNTPNKVFHDFGVFKYESPFSCIYFTLMNWSLFLLFYFQYFMSNILPNIFWESDTSRLYPFHERLWVYDYIGRN